MTWIALFLFVLAVLHTFSVFFVAKLAHRFRSPSLVHHFFHALSQVEIVFAFWAFVYMVCYLILNGPSASLTYFNEFHFAEPLFVFVIMTQAATRPVLFLAKKLLSFLSSFIPFVSEKKAFYMTTLIVGPLLGSFITEPAAMTVTALTLLNVFYRHHMSSSFKYATLGLLFVNVSIGGTLTSFAAPPVLMVASKFGWDTPYMFFHFGDKAALAIISSTLLITWLFRKELEGRVAHEEERVHIPFGVVLVQLLFMVGSVFLSHHPQMILALFIVFLGFVHITSHHQDPLKLEEALLVGCFLGGLIILGREQEWWIQWVLAHLNPQSIYYGSTALTAIFDNAALTYLGSLAPLNDIEKYALVAGAVTGGGLTVIANAPNPAGYSLLSGAFGKEGILASKLFLWAMLPTVIAILAFQLL